MKKNRILKRMVAYVLMLCLVVTSLFVTDFGVAYAAEPTTRVWYYNAEVDATIMAYVWNAAEVGEALGAYPGAAMTEDGDSNWYYVDVAAAEGFNIKFSDGSDTELATSYINAGGVYVTATDTTYTGREAAETALGLGGNGGGATRVWFYNGDEYTTVMAYAWNAPGEALGGWPGTAATRDGDSKWYYIDVEYTGAFNIKFSNNGSDTEAAEAYIQNGGVYVTATDTTYTSKEAAEKALGLGGNGGGASETTRVWYYNANEYATVMAYTWNAPGEALGSWPGTVATRDGDSKWYYVDVAYTGAFNIKFSNNGSDTEAAEAYIQNGGVYVTATDSTFTSKEAAEEALGQGGNGGGGTGTTRVWYYNADDWASVMAYTWNAPGEALGAWPGTAATRDGDSNWYYVDVPYTEAFNIKFNNNGSDVEAAEAYIQNGGVYVTATDTTFTSKDAAEEALSGSGSGGSGGGGTAGNPDLDDYEVVLNGVGANLGYIAYEAEDADTNGAVLAFDRAYLSLQSEASGRQAVVLDATGEYVEFTLPEAASGMVLRYSIPDSADGAGLDSSISLYVDGTEKQNLAVTSKYAWVYGGYPYNNNVNGGEPHRFYDEVRLNLGQVYPAGTKIKLQKDADNTASQYVIDFVELEQIPEAGTQPANSLSVTSYGAVANDGVDDRAAFEACISAAKAQGKEVWIPAGTFHLTNEQAFNVSGVTIRGAGMWHSNLVGAGVSFHYAGSCKFYDFAMTGVSTYRDDGGDLAGFEGTSNANNVTIENIWMEHIKVGVWSANTSNLVIQGCRIRNTYADGINLCSATNNSVVRNNSVRNTGDDGIASWPWQANCTTNVIEYNTVQLPMLANGIAVYGGGGWTIANNYVADTVVNGSGICIGSDYDSPSGFTGKVTVTNNILERCGTYHKDYQYPIGALWFWATKHAIDTEFEVSDNQLLNNTYEGILFDCFNTISGVSLENNSINGATDGIYIRGSVAGSATVDNFEFLNGSDQKINNENPNFTITLDESDDDDVEITGLAMDRTTATLTEGDNVTLSVSYAPANTTQTEVNWTTSNANVATVNNGVVTAVGEGTATITVTSAANANVKATCTITVEKRVVAVTGLTLNRTSATLTEGNGITLSVWYAPANTTQTEVTWSSSDESVATVDNGVVVAVGEGMATITVTSTANANVKATCTITVEAEEVPEPIVNPFGDVKESDWYYQYVMFAYKYNLMGGKGTMPDGKLKFDPANTITRAEFVQMLYSKEGKPAVEYVDTFADVADEKWYTDAILWAAEQEIVGGKKPDYFDVNGKITRQEIALILYKYALYKGYNTEELANADFSGFADASKIATWAETGMKWAVKYNVIGGKNVAGETLLSPGGNATRAEAATMMKAFMGVYEGIME